MHRAIRPFQSARAFLESREGFAASGKRASGAWRARALLDGSFDDIEKTNLGLTMPCADTRAAAGVTTLSPSAVACLEEERVGMSTREDAGGGGGVAAAAGESGASFSDSSASKTTGSPAARNIDSGGSDGMLPADDDANEAAMTASAAAAKSDSGGSEGAGEEERAPEGSGYPGNSSSTAPVARRSDADGLGGPASSDAASGVDADSPSTAEGSQDR